MILADFCFEWVELSTFMRNFAIGEAKNCILTLAES